ncbi:hypothetical protein Peur_008299 [Populus x canadensis]
MRERERDVIILLVMGVKDWRAPIKEYLLTRSSPSDRMKAIKLTKKALGYCLIDGVLYRRSTTSPLLKCLSSEENNYVLREIHEGVYGLHTGFRALAAQTTRADFYWPSILQDSKNLVKTCDECQRFSLVSRQLSAEMAAITFHWLFCH